MIYLREPIDDCLFHHVALACAYGVNAVDELAMDDLVSSESLAWIWALQHQHVQNYVFILR